MTVDKGIERKIDRLVSAIEDLGDDLDRVRDDLDGVRDDLDGVTDSDLILAAIDMRDLLDAISYDDDIPVFRRNQARDLVRTVDEDFGADFKDAAAAA